MNTFTYPTGPLVHPIHPLCTLFTSLLIHTALSSYPKVSL